MDILMSEGQPKRPPRGFAALHRDVWRVVRKVPFVFLALPVIVWFPIDVAIEGVVANMELDYWGELRFYFKLERLAQWIFGTLVIAVQMQALQVLAKQQSIRVFDARIRPEFRGTAK